MLERRCHQNRALTLVRTGTAAGRTWSSDTAARLRVDQRGTAVQDRALRHHRIVRNRSLALGIDSPRLGRCTARPRGTATRPR